MAKTINRQQKSKRGSIANERSPDVSQEPDVRMRRKATRPLEPQTEAQARYLMAIQRSQVVIAIGPAGTGKTYIAATHAAIIFDLTNVDASAATFTLNLKNFSVNFI